MKHLDNFCHHPWEGLDINAQGEFRPCCKYTTPIATNLDNYLNSTELHELREQFLRGERPTKCERCWKDEDAGIASKRQLDSNYIFKGHSQPLTQTRYLSTTFGNSCNIACRTCHSYSSSSWIRDERELSKDRKITIYPHNDFFKDEQYKQDLYSVVATATNILISGGEPFLAGKREHIEFLDQIRTNSSDVSITYITNGTTRPADELWQKLKTVKQVEFHVSIDGTDRVFEYLRYPAKWNEVLENLEAYRKMAERLDNVTLSLGHTVSIMNVWYLPDFFIWCLKNKFPKPYIGMVTHPNHYNIQNLPRHAKEKLTDRLDRHNLNEITSFMMGERESDEEFDKFRELTARLDELRNQHISESLPELVDLIGDPIVK